MSVVPIQGLYEAHLTVGDLERSIAFYRDVLGLTLAHRVPERRAAFFWVGARERGMLGLWEIGSSPIRARLHISFAAGLDDVAAAVDRLRAAGIEPRAENRAEPVVFAWMPAASVFFDDPDGHSLEYIALLDEAPRPELGVIPLSRWRALADKAPSASGDEATASSPAARESTAPGAGSPRS
jgi:lactoylglutathione lyase